MEFAKPHKKTPSVTTKSNIRILPLPDKTNNNDGHNIKEKIDSMLIECANEATLELFQCKASHADASLYPERSVDRTDVITPGSLCVIFESFDVLNFVYAKPKAIFSNRNGHFHHDDFINKPYGCKIRSRNKQGLGFVYILRPTPELWARSLNHRTQIIHELDASMILFQLNIKPGMVVCESGTGSGSMSHAFMRSIAPEGHLHTYEFNKARVDAARIEFQKNKVDHLVTVHHRDVCGKKSNKNSNGSSDNEEVPAEDRGGFGPISTPTDKTLRSKHLADAILLDLPEPWLAIPHAKEILKPNARIASYSPCVEQSQKTIAKMTEYGFHSIKTIEVRLKEYYVDEVESEMPPTFRLPDREASASWNHTDTNNPNDETEGETEGEKKEEIKQETSDNSAQVAKKIKMTCARPMGNMRGHTAFLTFATAGLK